MHFEMLSLSFIVPLTILSLIALVINVTILLIVILCKQVNKVNSQQVKNRSKFSFKIIFYFTRHFTHRWHQVIFFYSIWASLNHCCALFSWYFRYHCWRAAMKIQLLTAFAMWMHSLWHFYIQSPYGLYADSISIDTIAFQLHFITMPLSVRIRWECYFEK